MSWEGTINIFRPAWLLSTLFSFLFHHLSLWLSETRRRWGKIKILFLHSLHRKQPPLPAPLESEIPEPPRGSFLDLQCRNATLSHTHNPFCTLIQFLIYNYWQSTALHKTCVIDHASLVSKLLMENELRNNNIILMIFSPHWTTL